MSAQERSAGDGEAADRAAPEPAALVSRRRFVVGAGAGTAAAAGMVWAAPRISTVRYVRRAAIGSAPPKGTTVPPRVGPLGGELTLSTTSPCVGDDVHIAGGGFAPRTGVAIQLDSDAHPLSMLESDALGAIAITVKLTGATGAHSLRAVGVQSGGQTLVLSAAITIKTEAECATPVSAQGTHDPTANAPAAADSHGSSLPLTGGDATDLAVLGGAAVLAGRSLYGAAKRRSDSPDRR